MKNKDINKLKELIIDFIVEYRVSLDMRLNNFSNKIDRELAKEKKQ